MTLTLNKSNYFKLLEEMQIIPKIIDNEEEYEKYLAIAEKLISKKNNRTLEETVLFRLIVKLIEDYEEKTYSISDWCNLSPHEILEYVIESSGMVENDLVGIIGSEKKVHELIHNKKNIGHIEAQALGNYFQISPSLFQN